MTSHPVEGQWLDFYALLDVPVNADEDTIRKRIGKVYSEAAANSDHRDLSRRHYFQALVERVLPQCRRVLLDPQWRAKYDRQHILHSINDPSSQDYVTFIASMRGKESSDSDLETLPQRIQDEIKAAHEVVQCARQGTELDLLPSRAISSKETLPGLSREIPAQERRGDAKRERATAFQKLPNPKTPIEGAVAPGAVAPGAVAGAAIAPGAAGAKTVVSSSAPPALQASIHLGDGITPASQTASTASTASTAPVFAETDAPVAVSSVKFPTPITPIVATQTPAPGVADAAQTEAEPVRAQVITAQEAAEIRRRRASNPDADPFVKPLREVGDGSVVIPKRRGWKPPVSRVSIDDPATYVAPKRLISPTSMNLMVAITGVLLTITIQKFASTPAVATNMGRTPIFVAVSSEMEAALIAAESGWEKTPEGANFDLIVQPIDSRGGLKRALGTGGQMPDVWIPSDLMWAELYNQQAPKLKREPLAAGQAIAQTPMVLIARSERAALLNQKFPNHQIPSWSALRDAVAAGAPGHFGLTDPQKATTGALARLSMAREWGASHGTNALGAAKNPQFWKWMSSFEENAPASPAQTGAMVKDLVLATTGRYWWGIAYESDALQWMNQGKALEIFYLPRTTLADHPFCAIDRVGAPVEVAQARASFEKYLRGTTMQKELLDGGFRPTEVSLKTKTRDNPFLSADFRARGARLDNLPRDERPNATALEAVVREWGRRFG